eukprot:11598969-Prorocentrum_lima.AAC.1
MVEADPATCSQSWAILESIAQMMYIQVRWLNWGKKWYAAPGKGRYNKIKSSVEDADPSHIQA